MKEGLSNKGAMGLPGAGAQGFGVVNQGVTRRMPGEGPDGGRNQSQELDSYDQPQYESWEEKIPGGLSSGKSPGDFDADKLKQGVKVELEHTTDVKIATEIAMDHLEEDPNYYDKLKKIESKSYKLTEVFKIKESPEVLAPGDWYEAVQFVQLDGANAADVLAKRAGHRVSPHSKPMKGYVVYEVQPDGTLKARAANWDSSD